MSCLIVPKKVFKITALIVRFNTTNSNWFLNSDTVYVIILYDKWSPWVEPGKFQNLHTRVSTDFIYRTGDNHSKTIIYGYGDLFENFEWDGACQTKVILKFKFIHRYGHPIIWFIKEELVIISNQEYGEVEYLIILQGDVHMWYIGWVVNNALYTTN